MLSPIMLCHSNSCAIEDLYASKYNSLNCCGRSQLSCVSMTGLETTEYTFNRRRNGRSQSKQWQNTGHISRHSDSNTSLSWTYETIIIDNDRMATKYSKKPSRFHCISWVLRLHLAIGFMYSFSIQTYFSDVEDLFQFLTVRSNEVSTVTHLILAWVFYIHRYLVVAFTLFSFLKD